MSSYATKTNDTHEEWDQTVFDSFGDQWDNSTSSTSYRDELNLLLVQLRSDHATSPPSQDVIHLNIFDTKEEDIK